MSEETYSPGNTVLNINRIIKLMVDLSEGKWDSIKPVMDEVGRLAKEKAKGAIDEGMKKIGLQELSDGGFSDMLVDCAENVGKLVHGFVTGKIEEDEFLERMKNVGVQDILVQLISALDIPEKLGLNSIDDIYKLTPLMLAYTASMAAYKEIRKALDDLEIARENRLRIEKECQESIAMIRQYRVEMEEVVSKYLTDRLEVFERGFAAMDKALVEGDSDGYLMGNAEIQKVLKYRTQFSNQKEFDDLMNSEASFKL